MRGRQTDRQTKREERSDERENTDDTRRGEEWWDRLKWNKND